VTRGNLRVALFPCTYSEIDGVANTSRQFASFAREHGFEFLLVHAGARNEVAVDGSVTRVQLPRGRVKFPLDGHHEFDLLFLRHYPKVLRLLREFDPHVIHITGPSDVGILGALLGHNTGITVAGSWQTNLHQFARRRVSRLLSSWPENWSSTLARAAELGTFRAATQFYRIPRLLFAPNSELIEALGKATRRPCFLMSHSVNADTFRPDLRDRTGGPFRIGYVGRLTPEKNVRFFAQLEKDLVAAGHNDFRIVLIGQGSEEKWLRENMTHAEFTGWLTGEDLSRAFANMDAFAFPSETDTFGLAVLEALASGVPAIVSPSGGPKFTVENGKSGYVVNRFDEFAPLLAKWMSQPDLLESMRVEARRRALSIGSWTEIFAGMYSAYERFAHTQTEVENILLDSAGKIANT
jgi:glycosyltransferase involved in cell wall biosynthesis